MCTDALMCDTKGLVGVRHIADDTLRLHKHSAMFGSPTCDAPHERDANRTRYPGGVVVQGRPYINDGHTSLLSKHSFLRGDEVYLQVWLVVWHMTLS